MRVRICTTKISHWQNIDIDNMHQALLLFFSIWRLPSIFHWGVRTDVLLQLQWCYSKTYQNICNIILTIFLINILVLKMCCIQIYSKRALSRAYSCPTQTTRCVWEWKGTSVGSNTLPVLTQVSAFVFVFASFCVCVCGIQYTGCPGTLYQNHLWHGHQATPVPKMVLIL